MMTKKVFQATLGWFGILALVGCASGPQPNRPESQTTGTAGMVPNAENMAGVYKQMGLMATDAPLAFVGKVAYFGTGSADTTLMLVTLSFPNRSLTFVRQDEQFSAPYEVRILLSHDTAQVRSITANEVVRVSNFREISRSDESIIFQRFFRVPPGQYRLSLALRDGGSSRGASQQGFVVVPAIRPGALSTPVVVYEAKPRTSLDSVPRFLPTPRSSATFGMDSAIVLYLEGYGSASQFPVRISIANERNQRTWTDTISLERRGAVASRLVPVPIGRAGLGISTITVSHVGSPDSAAARVFVGFGPEIPLMTYDELLSKLRWFASAERIRSLRDTPVDDRGRSWAQFRQATDPIPSTSEHEGLQSYFARLYAADVRFRSSGEMGYLSDRGMVFVTLGEPDQIFEQMVNQNNSSAYASNGRVQIWEYGQYNARLIFTDAGIGRWQLTNGSRIEFQSLSSRVLAR
ncbi:MAG: GWxTD domain-containing protein [Gemmatimonadaceae bacterium]|nr:GWxTD domain-containing protein [Gemmatimonadaceae bacterium]